MKDCLGCPCQFCRYERQRTWRNVRRQDVQDEIDAMERTFRRVVRTKKSALAFLVRAGIATPDGQLAPRFRAKPQQRVKRSTTARPTREGT